MNPRCNMTFVIVMLVVNVLIAWLNAYTAGTVWHDAKKEGGMLRFMAWSAAILSAIGFSQPILLAVTIGGQSWFAAHPELGVEHVKFAKLVVSLWYLLVILPVLSIGLVVTLQSWHEAIKSRNPIDVAVASWNTYAQVKNTLDAVDQLPQAAGAVGDAFGSAFGSLGDGDPDSVPALLLICVVVAVAIALTGGALITMALIQRYSRREARYDAVTAAK